MTYKIQGVSVVDATGNIIPGDKTKFVVNDALSFTQSPPQPPQAQGSVSGYTSGGNGPSGFSTTINKFPFASDANATDVGDITESKNDAAGQSSTVSGYTSGGAKPSLSNTVDKFPFATDANATDVGDLTELLGFAAGQQV